MKVSLVATKNKVVEGDLLRLELTDGKWVAFKNGYALVGVVPFAGMYGAVNPWDLDRFDGMVYCKAEYKVGIAMMCRVIVPTGFTMSEIREAMGRACVKE